ncbi:unnamed protein product [Medioppia subpectinata]|uniref:PAP-associated domain-containing protein n=1 Tax=Medioppia subpectinata TaxID=1979941 RepID=A0A7R9PZ21_9ACAR|nr:unnamed protein product [Medioppia subpectinata]CAG2106526.1 unnamed protein product [Medioppia subpectinata]
MSHHSSHTHIQSQSPAVGFPFAFDSFQTNAPKAKRNRANRNRNRKMRADSTASSLGMPAIGHMSDDHSSRPTLPKPNATARTHYNQQQHHQHQHQQQQHYHQRSGGQKKPQWYYADSGNGAGTLDQYRFQPPTDRQNSRFRERAQSNASMGGQSVGTVTSDYGRNHTRDQRWSGGYRRNEGRSAGHRNYYQRRKFNRGDVLTREMENHGMDNEQTPERLTRKTHLKDALHKILSSNFPNYEVEPFIVGSSANGLANNKSDVDICLVMTEIVEKRSAKDVKHVEPLKESDNRDSLINLDLISVTRDDLLDSVEKETSTPEPAVVDPAVETKPVVEKTDELKAIINYESDGEKLNVTACESPRSMASGAGSVSSTDPSIPMLKKVEEVLKNYNFVLNMQIIMAKVPILKFVDRISGIEVTLNVNKLVSIRNTVLIHDYVKYACSPPVLPCLQQLNPNGYTVKEAMHALRTNRKPKSWKSLNNSSLRDLLLGFLEYYSYSFCFAKDALSVRTAHVLPKHVVQRYKSDDNSYNHWKFLCVEEPFNRTNTARSVYDEVMFERILSVFRVNACSPPVLPCLQQLNPNGYTVKEAMHALRTNRKPKSWKSLNNSSLRDLLLGFLEYYSYSFCFAKDALSVRTAHVLPKHVVQRYKSDDNSYNHWKFLCVEEPFNRTNTARSVYDEVMFERILSVFRVSHYTLRRFPRLDSIMSSKEYNNDYTKVIDQYVTAIEPRPVVTVAGSPPVSVSPKTAAASVRESPLPSPDRKDTPDGVRPPTTPSVAAESSPKSSPKTGD